jgi:hypothetical protein
MNPIETTDNKEDKQVVPEESCDLQQSPQPPRNQADELPEPQPQLEETSQTSRILLGQCMTNS